MVIPASELKAGKDYPRDRLEFDTFFPDEGSCLAYLERVRWPDGFVCPRCGGSGTPWRSSRGLLVCSGCQGQTSVLAGTIFHRTRTPLRTWFLAAWEITSHKHGATALGIQRVLGLKSYQTAWAWLHKFRRAMVRPERDRLKGIVEIDEAYVGGLEEGARGRYTETKAIVAIAVEILEDDRLGRPHGVCARRQRRCPRKLCARVGAAGIERAHRWLDWVLRPYRSRVRSCHLQPVRIALSSSCAPAGSPSCGLPAQALASRDLPGRDIDLASAVLSRRVQLSFQPPKLACPRLALPPAHRTGRPAASYVDARPLPRHRPRATLSHCNLILNHYILWALESSKYPLPDFCSKYRSDIGLSSVDSNSLHRPSVYVGADGGHLRLRVPKNLWRGAWNRDAAKVSA